MSTTESKPVSANGYETTDIPPAYSAADYDYAAEQGDGWLIFAASMLGLAGTLGLIAGIAAIFDSSFYVNGSRFVFSGLSTWGWIVSALAVTTLFAAGGVVKRAQWARWFGMIVAGLQAIGQLMFVQAYPWWSLTVFSIDLLIIYGLAVYGGRLARTSD
jgi:hypothetical protein